VSRCERTCRGTIWSVVVEFEAVDPGAPAAFLQALIAAAVPHELRHHEPARHARHLAAVWDIPLSEAGRATLFVADGAPVLVLVPADRKVSAPRLRDLLGATDLRVLRGDRGVGRAGWHGLPGDPGALPAVPGLYAASCLLEARVMDLPRVVISLQPGQSLSLSPADYGRRTQATIASFTGSTRLLPEGGMVTEAESGPQNGNGA
jgi:prolyl-tRNA editing enzyme YbaK/EbsC (Cys-tRNA(Pro) deacylase)